MVGYNLWLNIQLAQFLFWDSRGWFKTSLNYCGPLVPNSFKEKPKGGCLNSWLKPLLKQGLESPSLLRHDLHHLCADLADLSGLGIAVGLHLHKRWFQKEARINLAQGVSQFSKMARVSFWLSFEYPLPTILGSKIHVAS